MSTHQRVAVSGASGFIGRSVVPMLRARGCEVVSIGRVDASQLGALMEDFRPHCVVHLATRFIASHEPDEISALVRANVEFGTILADSTSRVGARLVHVSSAWQRFNGSDYDPVSLYAATKQALVTILDFYVGSRGLDACEVTLFDTYGPGDTRPKLVPSLLAAARSGVPLPMSDGNQLIDLTYVDDVARGLVHLALSQEPPASCVLRTWEPRSIRELVAVMESAIGQPVPVEWGVRSPRSREMVRDWVFGSSPEGWSAEISLPDGLRRTWAAGA